MEASRRNVPRDRPVLDTSYQPSHNDAESLSVTKTSCDYKDDMIVAIAPLAVILLAFGGRWSVLVACVGGTICYIFDLLGSVEVCIEHFRSYDLLYLMHVNHFLFVGNNWYFDTYSVRRSGMLSVCCTSLSFGIITELLCHRAHVDSVVLLLPYKLQLFCWHSARDEHGSGRNESVNIRHTPYGGGIYYQLVSLHRNAVIRSSSLL